MQCVIPMLKGTEQQSYSYCVRGLPPASLKAPAQCHAEWPGQRHGGHECPSFDTQLLSLFPGDIQGYLLLALLCQLVQHLQLFSCCVAATYLQQHGPFGLVYIG